MTLAAGGQRIDELIAGRVDEVVARNLRAFETRLESHFFASVAQPWGTTEVAGIAPGMADQLARLALQAEDVHQSVVRLEQGARTSTEGLRERFGRLEQTVAQSLADLARWVEELHRQLLRRPEEGSLLPARSDRLVTTDQEVNAAGGPLPIPAATPLAVEPPSSGQPEGAIEPATEFLARLMRWLRDVHEPLALAEGAVGDPAAYLGRLRANWDAVQRAAGSRGWWSDMVHLGLPAGEGVASGCLRIHSIREIGSDLKVHCECGGSFTGSYLNQFALRVSENGGRFIAVLPAPGLEIDRHREAYQRITDGKIPNDATLVIRVVRPAVLRFSGSADLYTLVLPLVAEFIK